MTLEEQIASAKPLAEFYGNTIKELANLATEGNKLPISRFSGVPEILEGERRIARELGLIEDENNLENLYYTRKKILLRELYTDLKTIEALIGEGTLSEILERVRDPLLDNAIIWLNKKGGLDNVTRNDFIEGFEPKGMGYWSIVIYLRPLILFNLLSQFPEKLSKLNENSSYFPHYLFIKPEAIKTHKFTWREIEKETSKILPELFSDTLVEKISQIDKYIQPREPYGKSLKLGKYFIPDNILYKWTYVEGSEQELDELYNNIETKKEIYETLAKCFQLLREEAYSLGKKPKSMKNPDRAFYIPEKLFAKLKDNINAYAINQLIWEWRNRGFEAVEGSHLSKQLKLIPRVENDELIVEVRAIGASHRFKKEALETLEPRFFNTTQYLPLSAAVLNRFYKIAIAYQATENIHTTA